MKTSCGETPRTYPGGFSVFSEIGAAPDIATLRQNSLLTCTHSSTLSLLKMYRGINPEIAYRPTKFSRRCLTSPNVPRHNEGRDNENYDLILKVGDVLTSEPDNTHNNGWIPGTSYTIVDLLGQGTFGQVVKCRADDGSLVAVKVLKNKAAYFKQGLYEISILFLLNRFVDPDCSRHTLRLVDHFLYHNHLCIVNELLSINLYELLKQNRFHGVQIKLIQEFISQLLDAMIGLEEYEIIHCDLKPENILLVNLKESNVRLIDFGSACMEHAPQYSYIQSRHYRAPEVLLGLQYTTAIDMWSVGCIAGELLQGFPIFPGANEYNQMFKITSMLGKYPTAKMIEKGSKGKRLFKKGPVINGQQEYIFKTDKEYMRDTGEIIKGDKKYSKYDTIHDLVWGISIKVTSSTVPHKEIRRSLEHFINGLLAIDPAKRWTAQIARMHPFLRIGNEALDPNNPFPTPEAYEADRRLRDGKQARASLPPSPFQKTLTRETMFPPSVIRENGTLDCIAAYRMFMEALRRDEVIDIANGKPICPVVLEKKEKQRKAEEESKMELEDGGAQVEGAIDIECEERETPDKSQSVANSFSQVHFFAGPSGASQSVSSDGIGSPTSSGYAWGNSFSQSGLFGPNGANVPQAQGSFGTTSINLGASVSNDSGLCSGFCGVQGVMSAANPVNAPTLNK